jgi:hypothetical protein
MKNAFVFAAGLCLVPWLVASTAAAPSVTLTDSQCEKLAALINSDAQAAAQFAPIRQAADDALKDKPDPIPVILSEGKLASDPVKIRTWQSLRDMQKLNALGYAYAVTKTPAYPGKIHEFVMAWAQTNHSAGDPIDDTNLEGLLVAYDLARDTFSAEDRGIVDQYLRDFAQAEIKTGQSSSHTTVNNWNSHRLKIVGMIAFLLHDQDLIDHTVEAYQKQIQINLLPDGSSIDFHERDALHYQLYDLTPLLTLAIAARNNGVDLYDYHAPSGSSLPGGVGFVLPFAEGKQTHEEFVHSTVDFDRKRAAAGQAEYKAGSIWKPSNAVETLDKAEAFDHSLLPLIAKLKGSESDRFPTWQTVVNAVY